MIGYNDGKAMAIYHSLLILPALIVTSLISLVCIVPVIIFKIYWLLLVFILPIILTLVIILNFATIKYNDMVYLSGSVTKHTFELSNGVLFKDGKEIKRMKPIKIRIFKNFIFLELSRSYYRIENNEYIEGSRETFLASLIIDRKHRVSF